MLLARFVLMLSSFLPLPPLVASPSLQADNAGFDATDLLNRLRQKHARDGEAGKWFGVDVDTEGEEKVKYQEVELLHVAARTFLVNPPPPPPVFIVLPLPQVMVAVGMEDDQLRRMLYLR